MKRTLLATAVGLTFIGASAQLCLAQPYPERGGQSAQYGPPPPEQGPPPGDRDGWSYWRWRHAQRGRYSQTAPNENGPPGPGPGGPPLPPRRPPPPANAAHFVFQRGPARIDITCPQVFALQDCIQAATQLLDKINSLRAGTRHPGGNDAPGGGGASNPPAGSGGGHGPQPAPGGSGAPQLAPPNPGGDNRM